ncbi:MAG: hypothetical protein E4H40_06010 [Candidatus Brocadiia bacterium]|nr:MAG: hypothetical protein E4H40_06010 [Candidatus Brocadiia bacterium]
MIIGAMALVPGMPVIPFLILAGCTAFIGRLAGRTEKEQLKQSEIKSHKSVSEKQPIEEMLDMDRISIHVGVRLIGMVDPKKNSGIFDRIGALRRKYAQQLGIIIPLVRLRDDINLETHVYEIRLFDHAVAKGRLEPEMFLAMDSGSVINKVPGIETTEPVYGLPAIWVSKADKEKAELSGYTVIDPESVFITHLSETLRKYAAELLTREDVQLLVDRLRKTQPSLVGEVVGELVPIGLLQQVLKKLLANNIPIRELTAILESLSVNAVKTKDPGTLTELVRKSLSRTITAMSKNDSSRIPSIVMDPALEHKMLSSLKQQKEESTIGLTADSLMDFSRKVAQAWMNVMEKGLEKVVLLCDSRLRLPLATMLERTVPPLSVIAYDEVVFGVEIEPVETISFHGTEVNKLQEQELVKT